MSVDGNERKMENLSIQPTFLEGFESLKIFESKCKFSSANNEISTRYNLYFTFKVTGVIFSLFTPSGKKSRRESRTISFTI